MTDTADATALPPKKGSKLPLLAGLVLALALGGAGYYATSSGLIGGGHAEEPAPAGPAPLAPIGFVKIEPIVISLGPRSSSRHLRFAAELEVGSAETADVEHLMPRILDVLNTYLRAVEVREFDDPTALTRLRAQMLRRVQIVTGEGRVRDLLVTEFVLN